MSVSQTAHGVPFRLTTSSSKFEDFQSVSVSEIYSPPKKTGSSRNYPPLRRYPKPTSNPSPSDRPAVPTAHLSLRPLLLALSSATAAHDLQMKRISSAERVQPGRRVISSDGITPARGAPASSKSRPAITANTATSQKQCPVRIRRPPPFPASERATSTPTSSVSASSTPRRFAPYPALHASQSTPSKGTATSQSPRASFTSRIGPVRSIPGTFLRDAGAPRAKCCYCGTHEHRHIDCKMESGFLRKDSVDRRWKDERGVVYCIFFNGPRQRCPLWDCEERHACSLCGDGLHGAQACTTHCR